MFVKGLERGRFGFGEGVFGLAESLFRCSVAVGSSACAWAYIVILVISVEIITVATFKTRWP